MKVENYKCNALHIQKRLDYKSNNQQFKLAKSHTFAIIYLYTVQCMSNAKAR